MKTVLSNPACRARTVSEAIAKPRDLAQMEAPTDDAFPSAPIAFPPSL